MKLRFCYILIMVVSLFATNANGAPVAYSINSDSDTVNADYLYQIDLADGSGQKKPLPLFSSVSFHPNDFEGLAFAPITEIAPESVLWGMDDGFISTSPTMFPINPVIGAGNPLPSESVSFNGLQSGGHNDFGMTFTCDNSLYVTSVVTHTLYKLGMDGSVEVIGDLGANVHISAIAAIGNPTKLYGLGNGLFDSGEVDSPYLYSINTEDGLATKIGTGLGMGDSGPVYPYSEGGLAFASNGTLWAITDRSKTGQASQILSINVSTGAAAHVSYTHVNYTSEIIIGFESLAIAPPTDCDVKASRDGEEDPRIPTLGPGGLLFAVFALMFSGMAILRRRIS